MEMQNNVHGGHRRGGGVILIILPALIFLYVLCFSYTFLSKLHDAVGDCDAAAYSFVV